MLGYALGIVVCSFGLFGLGQLMWFLQSIVDFEACSFFLHLVINSVILPPGFCPSLVILRGTAYFICSIENKFLQVGPLILHMVAGHHWHVSWSLYP